MVHGSHKIKSMKIEKNELKQYQEMYVKRGTRLLAFIEQLLTSMTWLYYYYYHPKSPILELARCLILLRHLPPSLVI